MRQGDGGYNFAHIRENFRFEEEGKVPTNSKTIDMPQNLPMHPASPPAQLVKITSLVQEVMFESGYCGWLEKTKMGQGTIFKDHEDFPFHS